MQSYLIILNLGKGERKETPTLHLFQNAQAYKTFNKGRESSRLHWKKYCSLHLSTISYVSVRLISYRFCL